MSTTKIRGATQLVDESVPLVKLDPVVQDLITRERIRVDFSAQPGNTVFMNGAFSSSIPVEVYRNGVLQNPAEYTIGEGTLTLVDPCLSHETITVYYGASANTALSGLVGSDGSVLNIVSLTQVEYDAIPSPDSTTLYIITGD